MTTKRYSFWMGAALAGAFALAGCTEYSATPAMKGNPNTEPESMANAQGALKPSGGDFNSILGKSYYDMAAARRDSKDWVDADFFARKSYAASTGQAVPPEDNKRWLIPGQADQRTRTQLDEARQHLLAALDGGGRTRFPALAARTQVDYDCWIERSETNVTAEFRGHCRDQFVADLSDLEVALHPPGPFRVYFPYNSSTLTADGIGQVSAASAALPKQGTSRYQIVGHADRSGTDGYNMKLSEKRVTAVETALVSDGFSADRMDAKSTGEAPNGLPVQTKDSVREPKNRVVELYARVPGILEPNYYGH